MNKILIGVITAALIGGGVYYFKEHAKQAVSAELDAQITALTQQGFEVTDRKKIEGGEHFVVSIADAHAFSKLIPQYEALLKSGDKSILKDYKLGVDLVPNLDATLGADIYPVAIPLEDVTPEENATIQKHLSAKTLLLHLNYNPLTKNFDGNLKDIHEGDEKIEGKVKGFHFSGAYDGGKLSMKQSIERVELSEATGRKPIFALEGLQSDIVSEGTGFEVQNGTGSIKSIKMDVDDKVVVNLNDLSMKIASQKNAALLNQKVSLSAKSFDAKVENEKVEAENFTLGYGVENLNYDAVTKLQTLGLDPQADLQSKELQTILEQFLGSGLIFTVDQLSLQKITHNGDVLDDFSSTLKVELKKDPQILEKLKTSPIAATNALEMTSHIKISDALFKFLMQNPKAMMLAMVAPKEENGTKIFEIEFKEGALTINGQRMM